jgi:DNA (cytosine-5)-methyltransferase 1
VKPTRTFLYIDLFAGCGGLSLGLHHANWKGLFAIEKSVDAFETLKFNLVDNKKHFDWPSWLDIRNHNINDILKENTNNLKTLVGQVDLVAGGPPCQGFSTAGKRQENDSRNTLFNSYLEFVKIVRPKVIFFENVKAFNTGFKDGNGSRGEPFSKKVLERLNEMGYHDPIARVLNFSHYGIPQMRNRFIIIASLNGTSHYFFDFLEKNRASFLEAKSLNQTPTLGEAISDIEKENGTIKSPDSNNFNAGVYSEKPHSTYQALMRKKYSKEIPDSHRFVNHKKETAEKFQYIIQNHLSNNEIREKYGTKKTSTLLLKKDKPCFTLTTLPDDFIHYSEPRILTVREYARIQSFPDWFEFKGRYTTGTKMRRTTVPRYSQVGNAIPPLFSELCGMALKEMVTHI